MMRAHRLVVAATAALSLAAPAGAAAATVSGPTTLTLAGNAASDLERAKVKVTTGAGAAVVNSSDLPKYVLPSRTATFAATRTTLDHQGSLTFSRKARGKTRKVVIRDLQIRLGKSSELRAKVGGKQLTLATLDVRTSEYTAQPAGAVVRFSSVRLNLSKAGAQALSRGLSLAKLRRSGFGVLAANASAPTTGGDTTPGTGGTTPGTTPGSEPGSVPGPSGETLVPLPTPRLTRPASAVDLSSAALRWHLRESFVRYISEGNGVTPSAGATPGAPQGGVVYDYDFTPAAGSWSDPASGRARLLFTGRLFFRYVERGINIQLVDPEIELNGTQSRLIATFASGQSGGYQGAGEFATLELGAATTAGTSGGHFSYNATPAWLTEWANQSVMSGFYPAPGNDFGSINVNFTRAS